MFDRFADAVSRHVARAWFFTACVMSIVLWAPMILIIRNVDTYQLLVNTYTTILTFLLVALLQNTQRRFELLTVRQNKEILRRLDTIGDQVTSRRDT
jgi:low affinity Fe/Cu permease